MDSGSQDPVAAIEAALTVLRRHQHPGRGPHAGFGRGGGPAHRPAWGDGHSPWEQHAGPRDRLGGAARIRLLAALLHAGERRMGISELAEAIGVDQPRASRLVNESAERGLVARAADPVDARRSIVTLTDAGRALFERVRETSRSAVTDALAGFTEEETAQLAALLGRFAEGWPR